MTMPTRLGWLPVLLSAFSIAAVHQGVKAPEGGLYTQTQADRGRVFYLTFCSNCHGGDLSGREGPPLVGDAFKKRSEGRSFDDLVAQIQRMQISLTTSSHLDLDTSVDVLAFILSKNGYATGLAELPPKEETLRLMKFEAPK